MSANPAIIDFTTTRVQNAPSGRRQLGIDDLVSGLEKQIKNLGKTAGTPGPQGPPGKAGGGQGSQGPQGSPGAQGSQGPQGLTGSGAQGNQGNQGAQGATGTTGAQGSQGNQGFQGIQGSKGDQGFQGLKGDQGDQGTQGVAGSNGSQGTQGNQGNQGFQGTQGTQGNQGFQGNQGNQGNQGDIGLMGGLSLNYAFSTTTTAPTSNNGFVRINNANPALATHLYVTKADGNLIDQSAVLAIFKVDDVISFLSATTVFRKFVPDAVCRFQQILLRDLRMWDDLPYVKAHLVAVKQEKPRYYGELLI